MRKFLLAATMVAGLLSPAMAVSLDDITFADLAPELRPIYFQLMGSPCDISVKMRGNAAAENGYVTAVAVRWHMRTTMPLTDNDGLWLGFVCGSHPDYTVQEMIEGAIKIRILMEAKH